MNRESFATFKSGHRLWILDREGFFDNASAFYRCIIFPPVNRYTRVSSVLIAVNPLRPVPHPDLAKYRSVSLDSCPPHPYGVAELAFRQMELCLQRGLGANQSIVISGESGAGKTGTSFELIVSNPCWLVPSYSPPFRPSICNVCFYRNGQDRFEVPLFEIR
jgi:hypothetical protein